MGLLSSIIGGAAGFLVGGPVGALVGASLGGSLDAPDFGAGADADAGTAEASQATLQAAREAEALNRERYAEAQGYLDPYIGRSEDAAQQFQSEMGLSSDEGFTPRDMSDIPGYQAVMDESLRAVEQSAVSSGSTAYGGRRLEAAGEVGANVQQSYYTNYMNMLQNLSSPTVATNLSSMAMNQGVSVGQQNIAATNQSNQYMLEGRAAVNAQQSDIRAASNAQQSDLMGGIFSIGAGAFAGGYI